MGYLMPKQSLFKNSSDLTHSRGDNGVLIFLKGIYPKVTVIAWLEFELAYYDVAVQCVSHYTTGTPQRTLMKQILRKFLNEPTMNGIL